MAGDRAYGKKKRGVPVSDITSLFPGWALQQDGAEERAGLRTQKQLEEYRYAGILVKMRRDQFVRVVVGYVVGEGEAFAEGMNERMEAPSLADLLVQGSKHL